MAVVTSVEQLAGPHVAVYEEYWHIADSKQTGSLGAQDAVTFLKKSGLSDIILSKIWEFSDKGAKGYLDKQGFFCALKLIALVQSGQEATLGNLASSTGPPNLGPISLKQEQSGSSVWRVTTHEKTTYDLMFQNLQPIGGKLSGDKVKPVLINSELPVDVLGKIWELADHDKDGQLDSEEFAVAMHLVYQRKKENKPLPAALPPDLVPPSHVVHSRVPVGGVLVMPSGSALMPSSAPSHETTSWAPSPSMKTLPLQWVVSSQFKASADLRFNQLDTDVDGLVNGAEIRDIFLQSGLPQQILAQIWNLCDMHSIGSLNKDQFALALWLIEEKTIRGIDPPMQLTPEMIPPSLRSSNEQFSGPSPEASKELQQIEFEIEETKRRKLQLEAERQQKGADLKIKSGEVQTLQKEYEAVISTVKQLEIQRGTAQLTLDEMDDQKRRLEAEVRELRESCESKQREIKEINQQIITQDKYFREQDEELSRLKLEYSELHTQANILEKQIQSNKQHFEQYKANNLAITTDIQRARKQVDELKKLSESIEHAISQYQALINNVDGATEPDISTLKEPAPFIDSQPMVTSSRSTPTNSFSIDNDFNSSHNTFDINFEKTKSLFTTPDPFASSLSADPFSGADPFKASSAFHSDSFGSHDAFKADPFANEDPFKSDPFSSADGFKSNTSSKVTSDPFGEDVFKTKPSLPKTVQLKNESLPRPKSTDPFSSDPFEHFSQPARPSSTVPMSSQAKDLAAFDPFGFDTENTTAKSDPFGFDAFSSSAKEDPKKKPPPRPALPRPQTNAEKMAINPDPFKMSASSSPKTDKKTPRPKMPTPTHQDPFSGFGSDPFASSDPFSAGSSNGFSGSKSTFDANFADFGSGFEKSFDKDMAWAKSDGDKMEAERKRRLAEQEKADFEFALALSKAES